jgi:hypothetical protein
MPAVDGGGVAWTPRPDQSVAHAVKELAVCAEHRRRRRAPRPASVSDAEIFVALLLTGSSTTRQQMGMALLASLQRPNQLEAVRGPELTSL